MGWSYGQRKEMLGEREELQNTKNNRKSNREHVMFTKKIHIYVYVYTYINNLMNFI